MHNKKIILVSFLFAISFVAPVLVSAQAVTSVIPNCGANCNFGDLMQLIENIFGYIALYIVIPLATISFAWAGWRLLTNPTNSSERTKAKDSMLKVVIGVVVIVGSWLIVKYILDIFVNTNIVHVPIHF